MKANKCWITIAFALVLVIASCAPTPAPTAAPSPAAAPTAAAPATFNWKARQGETIRVLLWNHPEVDYWEKNIQEFKDLTGININFEKLSVAEQYPKTLLELTTAPDKVDVFSIVPPQQAYKFTKEGFMEDLNLFINDSTLTSPEYYFSDFLEGTRKGLEFKGIQGAMPMYVHAEMLMYRADLYQTAGLQPPKTFEELKANAAKLHDPANETYGAVYRGIGPQALWPFSAWMWGYGGDWVDNELDPTTNSPETVAAFKIYGEILGKYGPPGPTDLDDGRMLSLFQEGKAAHYMAFAGYALQLADPATSKVVGKVGYAMYPGGPKGQFPIAIPTGIAISSKSQHKEAAWL
ncbi:MAG TPA: extracellular solute-binding protein, partial [Anaerolineae bacterium]|nr:extracellular solute-binding protein [Anaerolineae bacterium]